MTGWWQRRATTGRPSFPWFPASHPLVDVRPNRYEFFTDDELLRRVHLDGLTYGAGAGWSDPDFSDPYWAGLPEMAAELARRSERPAFAARLIADVHLLPLVAMSVPLADFDPALVADLAIGLLTGPPIDSGATHLLHSHAVDATLRHLMSSAPAAALDVLAEPAALLTLASWDRLDQRLVHDFVRVGLYDSVTIGARTVEDGIDVIATLIDLTNGPLDRGMGVGAARGVADSMFGYVHSIAHGIGGLDPAAAVLATDDRGEAGRYLGTVADMRDLFGSLLRDDQARSTLATVLGAYTDETVERLGPRISSTSAADDPINFGLLLDAALLEEHIEIDVAAAADRAPAGSVWARRSGSGWVSVSAFWVSRRWSATSPRRWRREERPAPDDHRPRSAADSAPPPMRASCSVCSATLSSIRPVDAAYGLGGVSDAQWDDLRRRLAAVDDAADDVERQATIHDLKNHVALHVQPVDRLIVELSQMTGMDHLRIGGLSVDAD